MRLIPLHALRVHDKLVKVMLIEAWLHGKLTRGESETVLSFAKWFAFRPERARLNTEQLFSLAVHVGCHRERLQRLLAERD